MTTLNYKWSKFLLTLSILDVSRGAFFKLSQVNFNSKPMSRFTTVIRISYAVLNLSFIPGFEIINSIAPNGKTLNDKWPEPGCWPAVFLKTMVCCGCSVLQAQKNRFCLLLFKDFPQMAHRGTIMITQIKHRDFRRLRRLQWQPVVTRNFNSEK